MKKLNFGIIGAGMIAEVHAQALGELENAGLVGFFDTVTERAEALAKKYGCRAFRDLGEMLGDSSIDIVTIATPSGAHMEPAIAAAEAGKHVLCEKPLEVNVERLDAMIEAHEKSGTRLGGVFQNRFTDAIVPLRRAIEEKRFGVITYVGVYVPWWREDSYYKNSWHGTLKLDGGGALMNQSVHMIDMVCDLMGPVESVQAVMNRIGHPDIETEDTAAAVLKFAGGAIGVIYGTTASYPGQFKRFEISGTAGTVVYLEDSFTVWQFKDEQAEDQEVREKFGEVKGPGSIADPKAITTDNHVRNFRAFMEAIGEDRPFAISGAEARKSVALIQAIYRSANEGRMVRLDGEGSKS